MHIDLATEDRIINEFIAAGEAVFEGHFPFKAPVRSGTDFTVTTPVGPATLVPMLIHPRDFPATDLGAFCDALTSAILKKRPENPGEGGQAALLVYLQDTSYSLHGAGLALLRRHLHDGNPIFDHVMFFWPRLGGPGEIEILWPFPRELMPRDSVVQELRKMNLVEL